MTRKDDRSKSEVLISCLEDPDIRERLKEISGVLRTPKEIPPCEIIICCALRKGVVIEPADVKKLVQDALLYALFPSMCLLSINIFLQRRNICFCLMFRLATEIIHDSDISSSDLLVIVKQTAFWLLAVGASISQQLSAQEFFWSGFSQNDLLLTIAFYF